MENVNCYWWWITIPHVTFYRCLPYFPYPCCTLNKMYKNNHKKSQTLYFICAIPQSGVLKDTVGSLKITVFINSVTFSCLSVLPSAYLANSEHAASHSTNIYLEPIMYRQYSPCINYLFYFKSKASSLSLSIFNHWIFKSYLHFNVH